MVNKMNADKYPPINVLNIFKGFSRDGLQHHITPYRFQKQDGRSYHIKEVRQVTKHRAGGKLQFRYTVRTKEDIYFHLLFDTQTFTWRLIDEIKEGESTFK